MHKCRATSSPSDSAAASVSRLPQTCVRSKLVAVAAHVDAATHAAATRCCLLDASPHRWASNQLGFSPLANLTCNPDAHSDTVSLLLAARSPVHAYESPAGCYWAAGRC